MKIVLLCGGQGTRLREETEYKPKPMVDIGGKPIVLHIMKLFAHYGLREFILCLGYKGDIIKDFFLNYEAMTTDFTIKLGRKHELTYHGAHEEQEFSVTLADTGANSMTGGRVRRIRKYISDDLFMVTYGDGVSDVNIPELIQFHKSHGKLATVTAVRPQSKFGVLNVKGDGLVEQFSEKPSIEGWVNMGYFVFHKKIFDYLRGDETMLEREPLERLAAEGQLMAFKHHGFFFAMDTYREYQLLNDMWATGRAPWKVWS
ncbi:glucose-1-phosphate cytidylyltransferase [Telmatocola sphagniphila]|uniref:Glucose-1-phosphate cytidylyltransferase n=1 Tax=Telmatocola sphagniphila TaxID=1123043 RepID=A0A8E6B1P7_9BACT|nr:glucose-1-phosphate cytidylyltransferase [Telmatocola sphagniphila]QVL30162.1 glucose-1-phosphate cytidylyltransferase [Telmatocola sphagniphila]